MRAPRRGRARRVGCLAALFSGGLLLGAGTPAAETVDIGPDETVVEVKGIVCSFCAQDVRRALTGLEGLDEDRYEAGVLVDVDHRRVSLAFAPGVAIPFAEIDADVRDEGYEPVRFHVRIRGTASREGDGWRVRSQGGTQAFQLTGDPGELKEGGVLDVQVAVDAARIADLPPEATIPATVEKVFVIESG